MPEYVSLEKGKILIVDDSRLALRGFVRELRDAGFDVYGAVSGNEALGIARAVKIDMVFTDLIMSGMNGVELCREIKKISSRIEVVLVSGYPDEIEKCKKDFLDNGGIIEILQKPLGPDKLKETAVKILKQIKDQD